MNIKGRPISHLPGRVMVRAAAGLDHARLALLARFPGLFGLPVQGPFVQLYRHDDAFTTELSLFNYLSTFLPDIEQRMTYRVVAHGADGRRLGEGSVELQHGQTAQRALQDIVEAPLDRFGLFHVLAQADSADRVQTAAIGATSGQFMTLFYPRDWDAHAPQLLHSHKPLQVLPILRSPVVRRPHVTEAVTGLEQLQLFFLNPNPLALTVSLVVIDADSGAAVTQRERRIAGHGAIELAFSADVLKHWPATVAFEYRFDRQVSHMKPILFRTFAGGVATANHT